MRRLLLALTLMGLGSGPAWASLPPLDQARVDGAVIDAHRAGTFDGVVMVSRGDRLIYAGGFGLADRATGAKNGRAQLYRLASLTKQVTAVMVLQEVGRGRMALDQPIGRYLPGLSPDAGKPTVRQLLQHVSGLPNPSDGPDDVLPPFYLRTSPDAADNSKAARGFCSGPVKRPAGGNFEYNNCDYIVLGAALEALNGRSYAALLAERVAGPLKLKSWGVFPGDPAAQPKVAAAYPGDGKPEPFQNAATYGASGALYGTAEDVIAWDRAILGHKLISPELTALMFTPDPKLYGEGLSSWSYTLKFGEKTVRLWERQGDIGATRLLNLVAPEEGLSIVLIANTDKADLFDTYSKKGLGYAVVKAVVEP